MYPITLDRERNLKYGMRNTSLIEKKFKKPITKIDMDNLTMEETSIVLWAGLQHEDKSLTPDAVIDLVDDYTTYSEAVTVIMKALTLDMAGEEALAAMEKAMELELQGKKESKKAKNE